MVTGLMAATLLSGVAPAHAQAGAEQRGNRGGERSDRFEGGGGGAMMRGERMNQQRGERGWQPRADGSPQRWQQRPPAMGQAGSAGPQQARPEWNRPDQARPGQDRPEQARPDPRPNPQWSGSQGRPGVGSPASQRGDWRQDRRDDRQDWRGDRRDDRRDDRQDWRNDRRDDRGWTDNRGWNGNNWNQGRRYDDRTRWANQRRWDNGWRNDRRYDWNSYRNRYGDRYRVGRYYAPRGWDYGYRRFSVGIFLSNMLYANNYWLDDPYSYRLPPAYGSLRWIRYYDDALLVDIRDGYVVDVINDFFW